MLLLNKVKTRNRSTPRRAHIKPSLSHILNLLLMTYSTLQCIISTNKPTSTAHKFIITPYLVQLHTRKLKHNRLQPPTKQPHQQFRDNIAQAAVVRRNV